MGYRHRVGIALALVEEAHESEGGMGDDKLKNLLCSGLEVGLRMHPLLWKHWSCRYREEDGCGLQSYENGMKMI